MPILAFRYSLDKTQQEELNKVRELLVNFLNQFHSAFEENSQEPSNQWELVRMSVMAEIIKEIHTITLYDYQAIEYLVLLFFTYIRTNNYKHYNSDLLKIAESSFINYCMRTGPNISGFDQKDMDISLSSYYDLHNFAKEECEAKFYFSVYTLCPLVMEHCRKMYTKLTTPQLARIK